METSVVRASSQRLKNIKVASPSLGGKHGAASNELNDLCSVLSSKQEWAVRQAAARKLGDIGNLEILPKLLEALANDPFWMVRSAIIQSVEKIGDGRAIPTLKVVAEKDSFAVVRGYAAKAIERLLIS